MAIAHASPEGRPFHARVAAHRRIWAGVLLITSILLIVFNYYIFAVSRRDEMRQATADVAAIADNLGDRIDQTFQVVEISLQNLLQRYRTQAFSPNEVYLLLRQIEQTLPQIRSIGITDAAGVVIHSSRSFPPPAVSIADREQIQHFLQGGRDPRFLAGPSKNALDGRWQLALALPVLGEGNNLAGVITTVIDPDFFAEAFARTASSRGDAVKLLYHDFRLVTAQPRQDADVGRSFADSPLFLELASSINGEASGLFSETSIGDDHLSVARRVYNDLLILSVSRPISEVLDHWYRLAFLSVVITITLLLIEALAFFGTSWNLRNIEANELELWALNEELAAQTQRAEQAAEAKGVFLANMSHEIRTPLGGMLGYADLLLKSRLDPDQADWMRKLRSAGHQLLAVINDILDYSKLEAGEFSVSPASVDLRPMVDEIRVMMAPQAEAKGLSLGVTIDDEMPLWIRIDAVRFKQILINLLSNAVKFTDRGGITVELDPATLPDGRVAFRTRVQDTGIGIPADKLATVFERFTQADNDIARGRGGTGLGLSISQRLAELMGGALTLKSTEGTGTTVDVVLPLDVVAPLAENLSPRSQAERPGRILLVDDLQMNLEIIGAMLNAHGHNVTTASTGLDAIDLAIGGQFDAVLLDINLPDIDGYEVAREIRKLEEEGRRTPIVALSANALPEHIGRALEAGMDGHISKPVDEDRLIEKLTEVMAGENSGGGAAAAKVLGNPLVDRGAVATLKRLVGPDRLAVLRAGFWSDWEHFDRELTQPSPPPAAIEQHAHAMVSNAGNIGYRRLAEACRSLSHTAARDGADMGTAIDDVRRIAEETRRATV